MARRTEAGVSPKRNLASWDRILRVIVGLGLFAWAWRLSAVGLLTAIGAFFGGIQVTSGLDGY